MEKILDLLIDWMVHHPDWIKLKGTVEQGKPISQNLDKHVLYFKLVAMYMGLQAESQQTKQLFTESSGTIHLASIHHPLQVIIESALNSRRQFERQSKIDAFIARMEEKEERGESTNTSAAVTIRRNIVSQNKRPRIDYTYQVPGKRQEANPVSKRKDTSFNCGEFGHFKRDCPRLKKEGLRIRQKEQSQRTPLRQSSKQHFACAAMEPDDLVHA